MDTKGSEGSWTGGNNLELAGAGLYCNMSHSVFTSMYFGVNPARTVLSEQAMHSIQSRERERYNMSMYCTCILKLHYSIFQQKKLSVKRLNQLL